MTMCSEDSDRATSMAYRSQPPKPIDGTATTIRDNHAPGSSVERGSTAGVEIGAVATEQTLYLIEPFAHETNGHWADSLGRLSLASSARARTVVVAPQPLASSLHQQLLSAGIAVRDPAISSASSRLLHVVFRVVRRAEQIARRVGSADAHIAEDLWLLGVAFQEMVLLRAIRDQVEPGSRRVLVLTGSAAFLGMIATLSAVPHVRFLHDARGPRGVVARFLDRRWRSRISSMRLYCTTDSLRASLAERGVATGVRVQTFAMRADGDYLAEAERIEARTAMGIRDDQFVIGLVGGWWPAKDVDTVALALRLTSEPVHALVAGEPLRPEALASMEQALEGQLTVIDKGLSADELRMVYACCDASVVSRWRGVTKESGLVMDAVKYGVPLIVSDHDPTLTARVAREPWALSFRAQDPGSLAEAIDKAAVGALERPPVQAAVDFGLPTAEEVLDCL